MSIPGLIEQQFGEGYLGMEDVPVARMVDSKTEILKAFLGRNPDKPYLGSILTVVRHDSRFFVLIYHVWRAGQKPAEANRLLEIQELNVREYLGIEFLERVNTDFGLRAFWLHTPDSDLDAHALALRTVAGVLKQYSVSHQLCARFRRENKIA